MLWPGKDALSRATHERHRPEKTLLCQLIEKYYRALTEQLEAQGKRLPLHVPQEFEAYLKCGRLEYGFLRIPPQMQLGIHSNKRRSLRVGFYCS
jgi:hypothetical protein